MERNGEEGQSIVAKIRNNEVSLHKTDVDMIPEAPWRKDGWELSPLIRPPTVSYKIIASLLVEYVC